MATKLRYGGVSIDITQVALQLYTVRDQLKTPVEIASSLKKVRAIGYEAVQVSGLGPIDEHELKTILEGEGLTLCATHEPSQQILDEPERVTERLNRLNCTLTAYPFPQGVDFGSEESVQNLISKLNRAGEVLDRAGQKLAYHNHQHEFRKLNGRVILDRIYAETDPRFLQGEIDTYWVQYGGGDPVSYCGSLRGRLPLIHLKDYAVGQDSLPFMTEIGKGNLNFKAIIAAAEKSGCSWFIVEQDTCPGNPIDSARESFDYIRAHLCS